MSVLNQNRVFKFLFTGGPCGGKTTMLSVLKEYFEKNSYRVFIVPEACTLLSNSGCRREDLRSSFDLIQYQSNLISLHLTIEDSVVNHALSCGENSIVLLDRGPLEGKGFLTPDNWDKVLKKNKLDELLLKDRYKEVIHLVSTAVDIPHAYTNENNSVRTENVDMAAALDLKFRNIYFWSTIVDNSSDFDGKVKRVIIHIEKTLRM